MWLTYTKGTGSGSFSHSVARSIGSTGHLWTYEFHEARANKARCGWLHSCLPVGGDITFHLREEFAQHGMADIITLTYRNVCKDGFTVVDIVDSGKRPVLTSYMTIFRTCYLIYTVFLDLPAPWDAVYPSKMALRVRVNDAYGLNVANSLSRLEGSYHAHMLF